MSEQISPVTAVDVEEYIKQYYDSVLEASDGMVYEALCECAVEKNESYRMENLATEWVNSDMDKRAFASMKFDAVVDDSLKSLLTLEHREKWIEATVLGVVECQDR